MVAQTRGLEIVVTHNEVEALLLEANLIQRFMLPFNVLLRDDKSYPYILITKDHDFPQLLKHRGAKGRKGWYFGPFASAGAVNRTLTAAACASRPSSRAKVMAVPARPFRPDGDSSCTVMRFWKSSTDSPLWDLA